MKKRTFFIAAFVGLFLFSSLSPGVADFNGASSLAWAAELTNTPPIIYRIRGKVFNEDTPKRIRFIVSDAESDPITLRVRARSGNQVLIPKANMRLVGNGYYRRLEVLPAPNQFGTARMTLRASDGLLFSRKSFMVTVLPVNDPPTFTSTPPTGVLAGAAYSYLVTTADVDPGDTRTVSAVTKPSWLGLTSTGNGTATLAGTPALDGPGSYPVQLKVTDAGGASAYQDFTIIVAKATVAQPTFDPNGGQFADPVLVTMSTTTPGASIRYTTDGTTPTNTVGTLYGGPVNVGSVATLRAVGFRTNVTTSSVAQADFSFSPYVANQSPDIGDVETTIKGEVNPRGLPTTAWFEWGDDPDLASPTLTPDIDCGSGTGAVPVSVEVTGLTPDNTYYYRTAASNSVGTVKSAIVPFTTLFPADPPTIDPNGGTYSAAVLITLATTTTGASIRYTTDGTTPTATSGRLYSAPFSLATTATVTAVAYKTGLAVSDPTEADFMFTPVAHTWTSAVTAATAATIYGRMNPRGLATAGWLEWGTDPALGTYSSSTHQDLGSGTAFESISVNLSSLTPGGTYYYRAAAQSSAGTIRGSIKSFDVNYAASIQVTTLVDAATPPPGYMTLREAVTRIAPGGTITFNSSLNGGRIDLSIIGEADSILKGEVFTMSGGKWSFEGFQERNYGKSALYAHKDLTIDASSLTNGITFAWAGGVSSHARVLAVYGDLTMDNVTVTDGDVVAEAIEGDINQPYSLARGGGVAVWGTATLDYCVLAGNNVTGDVNGSRDRGAFGGGIYGDTLVMNDCIVSGNTVTGYGGAGGGVYSVSGADTYIGSLLNRTTVSGNRVTAQHAYGGGVYTDGGGPGNMSWLDVYSSTIARNQVEDHPGIDQSAMSQYYYRGGGVYMSNGYLVVYGSTIVENDVTGNPYTFNGKPNMGGGGMAATIGDAHVVENMKIWHSIIAGNSVGGSAEDIFTGSLLDFFSFGYNLIGEIDFTYILVPVPSWYCLSRRHYPKIGDTDGVALADVVDLANVETHSWILSAGTDAGDPAVLWYPPLGDAVDAIPPGDYSVDYIWAQYTLINVNERDDFPDLVLEKLRTEYSPPLPGDFGVGWDTSDVIWYEEPYTWPSKPENKPWIDFWRQIDAEIGDLMGTVRLGDDFWGTYTTGQLGDNINMEVMVGTEPSIYSSTEDQIGNPRYNNNGDIGAIEAP